MSISFTTHTNGPLLKRLEDSYPLDSTTKIERKQSINGEEKIVQISLPPIQVSLGIDTDKKPRYVIEEPKISEDILRDLQRNKKVLMNRVNLDALGQLNKENNQTEKTYKKSIQNQSQTYKSSIEKTLDISVSSSDLSALQTAMYREKMQLGPFTALHHDKQINTYFVTPNSFAQIELNGEKYASNIKVSKRYLNKTILKIGQLLGEHLSSANPQLELKNPSVDISPNEISHIKLHLDKEKPFIETSFK